MKRILWHLVFGSRFQPSTPPILAQPSCVYTVQDWLTDLSHGHGCLGNPSCWAGPSLCRCTRLRPPAARWSASMCRCSQMPVVCGWTVAMLNFCTILSSSKGSQSHDSEQKHPVQRSLWCFSLDECWHGLKRTEIEKDIFLFKFSVHSHWHQFCEVGVSAN